ncbi:hypothetical protein BPAE_0021g00350 [Botrytis paeoniae]|uniref:Uncharacterized protein n=1 Tax=Botrytis paeoniae TaxID=278948 RepID=A0A4Z1G3N0_9HELO|nr:hypothetical protein BPAE_0021g00350 [Botrytis paeoniae]
MAMPFELNTRFAPIITFNFPCKKDLLGPFQSIMEEIRSRGAVSEKGREKAEKRR